MQLLLMFIYQLCRDEIWLFKKFWFLPWTGKWDFVILWCRSTSVCNKTPKQGKSILLEGVYLWYSEVSLTFKTFASVWRSLYARCCERGASQEDSSQWWDWCSIWPFGLVYWRWSFQFCEITESSEVHRWKVCALGIPCYLLWMVLINLRVL